ncbi:hypothetical protein [Bacillus sp. EB600]|uniref:hypothetical protein n=1 Tax=Bacillus sp. EB600 TaxID=2806345 RepID=UPI00210D1F6B|nr:hypothetical protein [Bacillus sp. EB600]MCQ6282121.1 hypothetical protein [Bacillus sp. EB600]
MAVTIFSILCSKSKNACCFGLYFVSAKGIYGYTDKEKQITFWGAVIGGVISGILTLLGVQLTIKHNNEQKRKEEFPRKLNHLEKITTFLENTDRDFKHMMSLEYFGERSSIFFEIDDNFQIKKTEKHTLYTEYLLEGINKDIVFVDAFSYRIFFVTRRKINDLYKEIMWEVEHQLFEFTQDLIKLRSKEGFDVVNINWSDLEQDDDQIKVINDIRRNLFKSEREYISTLIEMVRDMKFQLTDHYLDLINEMNY